MDYALAFVIGVLITVVCSAVALSKEENPYRKKKSREEPEE